LTSARFTDLINLVYWLSSQHGCAHKAWVDLNGGFVVGNLVSSTNYSLYCCGNWRLGHCALAFHTPTSCEAHAKAQLIHKSTIGCILKPRSMSAATMHAHICMHACLLPSYVTWLKSEYLYTLASVWTTARQLAGVMPSAPWPRKSAKSG
jgi:hypothetical protein